MSCSTRRFESFFHTFTGEIEYKLMDSKEDITMSEYISIVAELERVDVKWDQASETEIKVLCPFHNDSSPSLYINSEKGACDCKACTWSGTFLGYLSKIEGKTIAEIDFEMRERYGQVLEKSIPPKRILKAQKQLWVEHALLQELQNRGLTADVIRKHKLGSERKRITIPIYCDRGFCVNVRKYLPGADGDKKFRDEKGCGRTVRLYPIAQQNYKQIVIAGGEIKALAATKTLNSAEIGVLSATGGEGRWSPELSETLNGKEKIWLAYDVDATGIAAAKKIAHQLAGYVQWLGIVILPMDRKKFPHGGLDDFLVQGGDILKLLEDCAEYKSPAVEVRKYEEDKTTYYESLSPLITGTNMGERVSGDCVVTTLDTMPYPVPKTVKVTCQKSIDWCQVCPMFAMKADDMTFPVHKESSNILGMIDVPTNALQKEIKNSLKIPKGCKVSECEILEFQFAEDARISEHLEVTKRTDDKTLVPAIIVSEGVTMSVPYNFTGRLYPHPKTNQARLLISELNKKKDSLDNFDCTQTADMEMFRPEKWTTESLQDKLDHIYTDLEANVTQIYQRRLMHLAIDLTYHSPLFLYNVLGKKQVKGWVETLILGDSSQGKTEAAEGIMNHYDLGGWLSCKGASFAGVLGGAQQINKKWFITWGAMPAQDRKLLVFEELKGLPVEILAKLTDVRSSGTAALAKIERQQTYARVRLLALSNPRSDRSVGTYSSGVAAIHELIGPLEDIRRFDLFYVAKKEDVSEDVIGLRRYAEHTYLQEYCRKLVLWAWTVCKTKFEDEDHLLARSQEFGRKYSDEIPIYDRGGGRFKIARLAAALACRTYSCEQPDEVLIRRCHVDYICNFLHKVYSSSAMGYEEYSTRQKELSNLRDEDKVLAEFNAAPSPRHLAQSILMNNSVDVVSISDICCWTKDEAQSFLSFLLRAHALKKGPRSQYYKTSAFVQFLKTSLVNNDINDIPLHIERPM